MNQNLKNYPLPIISVSKDGFVTAKNHSIEATFSMVHVGALVEKYTDIDLTAERFSSGTFCNVECSYCTMFDGEEILLFLSPNTVSGHSLSVNVINLYKERINSVYSQPISQTKTMDRKYVNAVNGKLVKANYFNAYQRIFSQRLEKQNPDESAAITKVLTAIKNVTANNLEDIKVNFDIDYAIGNVVTDVSEHTLISIVLNTLSFCIINSTSNVDVSLRDLNDAAEIRFDFSSRSSFDKWLNPDSDTLMNSSLSLLIATELAKNAGYTYSITKITEKLNHYTVTYRIPTTLNNEMLFSSSDTTMPTVKRLFSLIFFDSLS